MYEGGKDDSIKQIEGILFGSRYSRSNPFGSGKFSGVISDIQVYTRLLSDVDKRRLFKTLRESGVINTTHALDKASGDHSWAKP